MRAHTNLRSAFRFTMMMAAATGVTFAASQAHADTAANAAGAVKKLEDQIKKVGGVQNINEENMPEAHIRGDVNAQYKCIGAAIITMQQAGFQRVGFISEPPPTPGFRAE